MPASQINARGGENIAGVRSVPRRTRELTPARQLAALWARPEREQATFFAEIVRAAAAARDRAGVVE